MESNNLRRNEMKTYINRQRAFDMLSNCKTGALFMKMGAKKIDIALEFVKSQQFKVEYVIWIAPAAFLSDKTYRNEVRKSSLGLERKIYFFSIEAIACSDIKYLELYNIIDRFRVFCVVDESITIKNTEAGRTQRLLKMASKFKYRLILSSTPLTQGLIDLYSQIMFMNPAILNMTETQFANSFLFNLYDDDKTKRKWSLPQHEQQLIKLMRPYIYECDLEFDCPINYINYNFSLSPREALSYRQEKEFFLTGRDKVSFLEVAQKFQHMYTICTEKTLALVRLIEEIIKRGEKVIVFVKFMDELNCLKECGVLKFAYVEMIGSVNKNKAVAAFAKEIPVMFSTYGAGGYSLHMPFCNNIIFFSQTFDYKDKIQSLDSIYMKGQNYHINVYNFWMQTGLENLIRASLARKKNVLCNVCRYITKEEMLSL